MAGEIEDKEATRPLQSDRVKEYLVEIQSIIEQGIEHPLFEFKRSASILRDDLDDRLDFIKLLQGVANCDLTGERCIVIGADPKQKAFFSVTNTEDFDPAKVAVIVAKYLDPMPALEVFNSLSVDDGSLIVVIVLAANQPRPIMVKTKGVGKEGKTCTLLFET